MSPGNDPHREPTIFSAILTPHRSLDRYGFFVLMALICFVSFIAGLVFVIAGAWPVMGFLGLDAALIYWAFRVNYHAAAAYEEVKVTPSELLVRKVSHRGKVREWTLNPLWVRLEEIASEEFGIERLYLISHGRKLPIAAFLGPQEKQSFALALAAALGEAKRGPTRTIL